MDRLEDALRLASGATTKIRRPPNAYIIFARELSRKLAEDYPEEGNQQISIRLGNIWRSMAPEEKEKYFDLARHMAQEHRRRYPGLYRRMMHQGPLLRPYPVNNAHK